MGDSPAKKINFEAAGKENAPIDTPVVEELDIKKPLVEVVKKEEKLAVAATIKPEEADEPLLQENPHRFVLFPIKYHEVRVGMLGTRTIPFTLQLTSTLATDMANVQEGRSLILDCRRDRSLQRPARLEQPNERR